MSFTRHTVSKFTRTSEPRLANSTPFTRIQRPLITSLRLSLSSSCSDQNSFLALSRSPASCLDIATELAKDDVPSVVGVNASRGQDCIPERSEKGVGIAHDRI